MPRPRRTFARIEVSIFTHPKFRALTPNAKLLYLGLITIAVDERSELLPPIWNRDRPKIIADRIGIDPRSVISALQKCAAMGLITIDPDGEITVCHVKEYHEKLPWSERSKREGYPTHNGTISALVEQSRVENSTEEKTPLPPTGGGLAIPASAVDSIIHRIPEPPTRKPTPKPPQVTAPPHKGTVLTADEIERTATEQSARHIAAQFFRATGRMKGHGDVKADILRLIGRGYPPDQLLNDLLQLLTDPLYHTENSWKVFSELELRKLPPPEPDQHRRQRLMEEEAMRQVKEARAKQEAKT